MSRPPRPLTDAERLHWCPLCASQPGQRCTNPSGSVYPSGNHAARRSAAALPPDVARLRERQRQLSEFFGLLLRMAEVSPDPDLLDRIERVIKLAERNCRSLRERQAGRPLIPGPLEGCISQTMPGAIRYVPQPAPHSAR